MWHEMRLEKSGLDTDIKLLDGVKYAVLGGDE